MVALPALTKTEIPGWARTALAPWTVEGG
jgi:hypothetical protein